MEPSAVNWHSVFFLLYALVACGFTVAVVLTANVVRMAFFLVIALGATAGLFFLAGADFVGAMQLMIYVGGTLVLLIFGVMLTAQGPFVSMRTGGGDWVASAVAAACLLAVLVQTAVSVDDWHGDRAAQAAMYTDDTRTATRLGMGLLGARVDRLEQPNPRLRQGMSGYLLPFEVVSVHLLVVLIGAAYLARTKKRAKEST